MEIQRQVQGTSLPLNLPQQLLTTFILTFYSVYNSFMCGIVLTPALQMCPQFQTRNKYLILTLNLGIKIVESRKANIASLLEWEIDPEK